MKFIIGKKIEMSQVWRGDEMISVTKVQAGPCVVVQVKNDQKDGYGALQLGYGVRKSKNINKPQIGHMKDLGYFQCLREFRMADSQAKPGEKIDVSTFEIGDHIKVQGTSKGRGFQGVVKRHGFRGHKKTHGTKDQVRTSGSVGPKGPAHVFKGTRMGGQMGDEAVTIANLEIIDIDKEQNILFIKGGLPGARNSLLFITGEGELKFAQENMLEAAEETGTAADKAPEIGEAESEPAAEGAVSAEAKAPEASDQPESAEKAAEK